MKNKCYNVSQMAAGLLKRNVDIFSVINDQIIIDEDKMIIAVLHTYDFEVNSNQGPFHSWTFIGSFPD